MINVTEFQNCLSPQLAGKVFNAGKKMEYDPPVASK